MTDLGKRSDDHDHIQNDYSSNISSTPDIQPEINNNSFNNEKYKYIYNIKDLPHKYITQPDSNQFFIKCDKDRLIFFISIILVGGMLALFIYLYIDDTNSYYQKYDNALYIGGISLLGFGFIAFIYGFIFTPMSITIILEDNYIKIRKKYNCYCYYTKNYRIGEIKGFDIELRKRNKKEDFSIIYIDEDDQRNYLCSQDFCLEEVEYFIYIVNSHIETKM